MKGTKNMISNPSFEWEQTICIKEDTFLECFEKARKLSEAKRLSISVMRDNERDGIFYSAKAYDELLKQINGLKHEISILKNRQN